MDRRSKDANRAQVVLAVLAVIAALSLLKAILIPVAVALVLACMLSPLARLVRSHLPYGPLGALVLFLLMVVGGLYLASLTAESLVRATYTLPTDIERPGRPGEPADHRAGPRPALSPRRPARAGDDRPARRHQSRAADRQAQLRPDRLHDLGGPGLHRPGPGHLPADRERDADGQGGPVLRPDPGRGPSPPARCSARSRRRSAPTWSPGRCSTPGWGSSWRWASGR